MKHLHIDIETRCKLDVGDVGVYRYAEDPTFSIILFAYSWDDGPTIALDTSADTFPGESIPADVWLALTDPNVLKIAHNANFEYVCIGTYFGLCLELRQWFCTMIAAAYLGLPLGLDKIGQVLGLSQQKDARGKALITYFCKPCKPTKKNGGRTQNLPEHDPEKWAEFKEYNAQDVRTEKEIYAYISRFPGLPDHEREYWILDQIINATGISVDHEFIKAAIELNAQFTKRVHDEIVDITGVCNPNSLPQLKRWLFQELGHQVHSLGKDYLADALDGELLPDHVERVLRLRQFASKTSISKYDTFLAYACSDGRIRGLLQFYGANRTGRFSGRGPQIQNLKRTLKKDIDVAREAVRYGFADLLYEDVPDIISRLTRTALVAAEGNSLVVSDFSAIEARVLAWEAGEDWVLDVFHTHGKIYEATAANMFNVPLDMITHGSDLRAKGKVATLALGYQGAAGALIAMGALREGLDEAELPAIVRAWRSANPNIVKLWREVENAAKHVIKNKTSYVLRKRYCSLKFLYDRGYLFIELPSGRRLAYYGASLDKGKLSYWGVDQTKKIWVKTDTYGGSLVENITQAIARDCLCDAMYRIYYDEGLPILMHIHDEVVSEAPDNEAPDALKAMYDIMAVGPSWAGGLPLKGDGYISKYYKKD
ncbi:DNA polymerase [Bacteroides stercorirosoris]|uniref:DNA-directed DNA polymerase n=2 Tax=Bacteroides stercorirosoris TaxID=871324 RepID=A0A1M6L5J8_9BACE|nr:DNA polymerase [Bacteroides stercorirosoris]SHJ66498.1 DNA polymerase [Bacteroides stercorirosoris]